MQKEKIKLGRIKETVLVGRLLKGSILVTAIFVLSFIFLPYILIEANAANPVSLDVNWGTVSLTLDTDVAATNQYDSTSGQEGSQIGDAGHGDVLFGEITPSAKTSGTTSAADGNVGTLRILKKTIGIETTGSYYSVYLSTNSTSSNALELTGESNVVIPAVSDANDNTKGTWASPMVFTKAGWGYAVPDTNITTDGTAGGSLPSFFTASTVSGKLEQDLMYTGGGAAYTATRWAAVPVYGAPQQIYKDTTSKTHGFGYDTTDNDLDTDNTFDVYYAVMADSDTMAGTYSNHIIYTALASASNLDQVSTNLIRDYKYGGAGDTETIEFDLAESALSSSISSSDIEVYLIEHSKMASANYNPTTLVSGTDYSSSDLCAIQTFSINTSRATLTCTIPSETVADELAVTTGGFYDFWVHIKGYNYNYVSKIDSGNQEAFAFVGLQSVDSNGNKLVTEMQEITEGICHNTYIWGNKWGSAAELYEADGTAKGKGDSLGLASTSGVLAKGSFALTDTRDGKKYIVRRQADGNCWMAQNLDLELYNGMTLTSNDTNISEERGSWTISDTAGATTSWVANYGSTSSRWQETHGVGSATLETYTYGTITEVDEETGEEETTTGFNLTNTETCEDGTEYQPCFVAVSSTQYVRISDNAVIANDTAAKNDTSHSYNTLADAYNGGVYGVRLTIYARKMNENVTAANQGLWASTAIGSSCVMTFDVNGNILPNADGTTLQYCTASTDGTTTITQYDGMTGYGVAVPTLSYNNETVLSADSLTSIATNAWDQRWQQNGYDGAHVYDQGPILFAYTFGTYDETTVPYASPKDAIEAGSLVNNAFSSTTTPTATSTYTLNAACPNPGTTQGTLRDSNSNLYTFITCTDGSGNNIADTKLEGNKYNWYAAIAGSTPTNNTSWGSDYAADSICPKGWVLPRYSGDKSFSNLITGSVGSTAWYNDQATGNALFTSGDAFGMDNIIYAGAKDTGVQSAPLSFPRSGFYNYYSGSLYSRGSYGYFWSSRSSSATNSYYLAFSASYLNPQGDANKGYGFAVRCVAQ